MVDELCSKLKEVEASDQGGKRELQLSKSSRKERSRPLSPREMARLYYAAFPALVPSNEPDPLSLQSTSAEISGISSNNQKSRNPHKQNSGNKDCPRPKKSHTPRDRHNAQAYRNHNTNHSSHKHKKSRKSYCNTEDLPEWVNDGDVWDMESQEHMQDLIKGIDEGYGTCDNTVVDEVPSSKRLYERDPESFLNIDGDEIISSRNWEMDETCKSPQKSPTEEESMAKFKAKFDRSLEALWPKEQNNNIEYELPLDFQDISSPSDRMFDCYSADKPLPVSLTSSIWSNYDSKSDWETNDFAMNNENFHPLNFVAETGGKNFLPVKQNPWENNDLYSKETMEVIYKKLKPLNLDDSDETSYDIKNANHSQSNSSSSFSKRNDEGTKEPYLFSFKLHQPPIGTPARSLNILNHSLYSSFTEVIPKAPGFVGDSFIRKNNVNLRLDLPKSMNTSETDEEDLLTSARTHFRPIKHDNADCLQNVVNYADGMTFPIVSDMDYVKFKRSNSGSIFLESDNEPPKRYMEYRKLGIDYARLDISSSSVCSDDSLTAKDLILKFKVCQTEKSVQTDDTDLIEHHKSNLLNSSHQNMQESFGSGNSTNQKVGNSNLDPDKELESLDLNWVQCDECKLNNNQWASDDWNSCKLNPSTIWSTDDTNCKTCTEQAKTLIMHCNSGKDKTHEEETAREWDELYSDIRYIHDLVKSDSDWREDLNTPNENYFIAPTEISIKAVDGNFVKSALLAKQNEAVDCLLWMNNSDGKRESNIVGKILDHSLIMYSKVEPHCEACIDDSANIENLTWRTDRKRRHSAVSGGRAKGEGKLRCTLPGQDSMYAARPLHMPLLPTADRPLTR